jgi:pyridoxamine 5'-phosphate oxidase
VPAREPAPGEAADPPFPRFAELLERARREEANDPTAMALATADANGRPSVRMVLLKGADERGFVFYTNYASRKAREMEDNPWASLCVYWPRLEIQVRAEGKVQRTSAEESDAYFRTRPRQSQLGAWASRQSEPMSGGGDLLARVARTLVRFPVGEVPRPAFWGGYRLLPDVVELWFGRPFRLHERHVYVRSGSVWTVRRLFP